MGSLLAALGFGLVLLVSAWGPSHAENPAMAALEIYQVLCLTELDVIEVRRLDVAPETAREVVARRDEKLAAANQLYVPDWHAHLDRDPKDPSYGIEPTTFKCRLSIGDAELVLLPEPIESLGNSIAVTLKVKERLIVDDVPFRLCAHSGPTTGLTYNAYAEQIVLVGRFSGTWLEGAELSAVFNATDRYFHFDRKEHGPGDLLTAGLRPKDIDYNGIDYDAGEGSTAEACRYREPGSPKGRAR